MSDATFTSFNLATMSGVFPGTRSQIFQRVRLQNMERAEEIRWAQILWMENPASCVVIARSNRSGEQEGEILLRLNEPKEGDLNLRLVEGLRQQGWQLRSCGTCHHWQPTTTFSVDGMQLGRCSLLRQPAEQVDTAMAPPDTLAMQSHLALDCTHWQAAQEQHQPHQEVLPPAPLPKVAEVSESKLKTLPRLQRRLSRWLRGETAPTGTAWQQRLLERSGVGAGTEPCFACQGRIANLGALTVESDEKDKQTFSVWRCRACFSLTLSNWTDRWERLENLETEELIYRIAPLEAAELLSVILAVPGGEHPAQRAKRSHLRQWLLHYEAGLALLSRQIKQGR